MGGFTQALLLPGLRAQGDYRGKWQEISVLDLGLETLTPQDQSSSSLFLCLILQPFLKPHAFQGPNKKTNNRGRKVSLY
jgi:hypothetical protein